jgi:hypothetical protein
MAMQRMKTTTGTISANFILLSVLPGIYQTLYMKMPPFPTGGKAAL